MLRSPLCLALTLCAVSAAAAGAQADIQQSLRQVAGILDYIAGDYRGAVGEDGRVLDPGEYQEQLSLAKDAQALANASGSAEGVALRAELTKLEAALQERAKPALVAALCRSARERVRAHGVKLGPTSLPSRELGARLYATSGCASCHGQDGSTNTDAARALTPRPANFLDPERMATVSPYRAFYALSFGVAGTAMQASPQLGEAERWSLAFYVLSLRHARADSSEGERLLGQSQAALPVSARALAELTDEDITRELGLLPSAAERGLVLSYLRAKAPFVASSEVGSARTQLARARNGLEAGLRAYRDGDEKTARRELIAAYLDGFEPYEAALSARDPKLVVELERAMLGLREAVGRRAPVSELEARLRHTQMLLARAERRPADPTSALVGALTIALREGLEAALLVTALLGIVRKRGQHELVRFVHGGWMLAVIAGLLTFWGASEALSGMRRELAEGFAALLAAVVLLGVTHWLFGQLTSRRFMGFVAERMGRAASSSRAAFGILGLSFVAAYREAFEIVLFFQALLLDAGEARNRVWLGAALGVAVLVAVTLVLGRVGRRLQPRPFMLASSALLALLAFTLTGKGVRALQEAGLLGITSLPWPELPWLGVHATVQGLLAQGLVLLLLALSAAWPLLTARRASRPETA